VVDSSKTNGMVCPASAEIRVQKRREKIRTSYTIHMTYYKRTGPTHMPLFGLLCSIESEEKSRII
jgi:hypothetical protein